MSNSNYEASFYENDSIISTEKAILAEDLEFTELKNIPGKFYIPVLTPEVDIESDINSRNYGAYQQSNYVNLIIPANLLIMFMNPSIERINGPINNYCLTFPTNKFIIPKGTVFTINFIGGSIRLDYITITSVFLQ